MSDLAKLWDQIGHDLGFWDHNMRRDRPYTGQPHTSTGARGSTEVKGITFRDLRDCFIRATFLSAHDQRPAHYQDAQRGEHSTLCENDLYALDWNKLDPMAVAQNLALEVERLMGIYPNVPAVASSEPPASGADAQASQL